MVYVPVRTQLLRRAETVRRGLFRRPLRLVDGLTMLIGQAEEAFAMFFGQAPPPGYEAELRELLKR
jgi:shikimate dehydrogenase